MGEEVVFKKRPRAGLRDVRKRVAEDDKDDATSSVVTKKTKGERDAAAAASLVPDRFGETTVHATERANDSATNSNVNREDATRGADWDVAEEMQYFHETTQAPKTNDDGTYRGMAHYAKYTQERDDGTSAKWKAKGPMKAPANVRTVTVVDYQPDICKDYKETGYCGFGDTCKFLHDRSDYLAGWQMNSMGEAADARAGSYGADLEDDDDKEEDIPFACLLCREPFTDPIVTLCGHYFCAKCAIARFTKTPKCFACGAKTHGLFNSATKIIERMNKRQSDKAEARAERRRMHGLDNDDSAITIDGVSSGT